MRDDQPTLWEVVRHAAGETDLRMWLFFVGGLALTISGLARGELTLIVVGAAMSGTPSTIALISARTGLLVQRGQATGGFSRVEVLGIAFVVVVIVGLLAAAVIAG